MATSTMFSSPSKFSVTDWKTSNIVVSSTAERQRNTSEQVRQESIQLRNATSNKTTWTQHRTNTDLKDRIDDTTLWRNTLDRCKSEVEKEQDLLSKTKDSVERAYGAKQVPVDVAFECLSLREQRKDTDLVRDDVESQLHKEVEVIEGTKNILLQKHEEAFEHLCVLQDVSQMVNSDLVDKDTALGIDKDCHGLENSTGTISLHKDPTRIMRGIVTVDTWDAFSAHNKDKADDEVKLSIRLRESMNQTILQTTSDLEAQWIATNYAFRKRIHEMEQAVRELEWQKKNTEEEIEAIQHEVEELKENIALKLPPLMVAHTRLEERTTRPNVELCRDIPQYQLVGEVQEVKESQWALQEKLTVAENTLGRLQRTLTQINSDLGIKQNSLDIDRNCMEVREKLKSHPSGEELIKHMHAGL